MQYNVCRLVPLHTLPGVVEQLVQSGALALVQGVVVQDLVRSEARVARVDTRLHQDVLSVQHLRHGEAVAEPLVHGGEGVLHRAGRFQPLRLQLRPGKLQCLGEELQTPHVEQELLEPPLQRSVILQAGRQTRGLSQSRQRSCLAPGHVNDCVHQHGDEPQLGKNLVMFGGQQGLLRQVWRRERTARTRVLVLLVETARGSPGDAREGVLSVELTSSTSSPSRSSRAPHGSVVEDDGVLGGHHLQVGGAGSPQASRVAARLIVVVSRREIVQVVGERLVGGAEDGGEGGSRRGEPA